jgi:hypothetical protein
MMKANRCWLILAAAFITGVYGGQSTLCAATTAWTGSGGSTDWGNAGNWSAGLPTALDRAAIAAVAGTHNVTIAGTYSAGSVDIGVGTSGLSGVVTMTSGSLSVADATSGHLLIGGAGTGFFTQTGGTVSTMLNVTLGSATGAGSGTYYLGDTGALSVRNLIVGQLAAGSFFQNQGGTSTLTGIGELYVGMGAGQQGLFAISTGSTASFGSGATIGYQGEGDFSQSGGSFASGDDVYLGFEEGSLGVASLTGGTFAMNKNGGRLVIGKAGEGALYLGYYDTTGYLGSPTNITTHLYIGKDEGSFGLLEGWGTVGFTGEIFLNGRLVANGYDEARTLDLSTMARLYNEHFTVDAGFGLYAVRRGKLKLPPITVATDRNAYMWGDNLYDSTPHLVNATKMASTNPISGSYTVELLAPDHPDVPLPLRTTSQIIGVWKYTTAFGNPGAGSAVAMRYDDALAAELGIDEADLRLYQFVDGQWRDISDTINEDYNVIIGVTDSYTMFAIGVDLEGISLGWYALSPYYSFDPTYDVNLGLTNAQRIDKWRASLVEAAAEGWDYVMMYGLNTYSYTVGGNTYDMTAFLDEAESLGVKVMVSLEGASGGVPTATEIDTIVGAVKDHPALYGYYLIDEPEMRSILASDCVTAYQHIKSLDSRHPVQITMSESMVTHSAFLEAADIVAKELYTEGQWAEVADDIAEAKAVGKYFVVVPNFFLGQGLYAQTLQDPEEFQYNIFAPILMGALYENGGGVMPFIFEGYTGWVVNPPATTNFRETICYPTTRVLQICSRYLSAGANTNCGFQWSGSSGANDARFKRVLLGEGTDNVLLIIINDYDGTSVESFKVTGLDPAVTTAQRLDSSHVTTLGTGGEIANQSFSAFEVKIYRLMAE